MKELARFLLVGMFNTAFGYVVIFFAMYVLGMSPVSSNVLGYACGLAGSFILNRTYTFRSTARSSRQAVRFVGVFLLAYVANLGVLIACIDLLGTSKDLGQVCGGVVYVAASYILNKFFVFNRDLAG